LASDSEALEILLEISLEILSLAGSRLRAGACRRTTFTILQKFISGFRLLTALLGVVYLLVICWSVWRHLRGVRP
jgi:hypothetical protein